MTAAPGRAYDPIAISTESTVVAEYVPEPGHDTAYQSEAALERELIAPGPHQLAVDGRRHCKQPRLVRPAGFRGAYHVGVEPPAQIPAQTEIPAAVHAAYRSANPSLLFLH